jgi:hypothetical protein
MLKQAKDLCAAGWLAAADKLESQGRMAGLARHTCDILAFECERMDGSSDAQKSVSLSWKGSTHWELCFFQPVINIKPLSCQEIRQSVLFQPSFIDYFQIGFAYSQWVTYDVRVVSKTDTSAFCLSHFQSFIIRALSCLVEHPSLSSSGTRYPHYLGFC